MKPLTEVDLIKEDLTFDYQPDLTEKLDSSTGMFDQSVINEITLWKVNRYPQISDKALVELNVILATDTKFNHDFVRNLLLSLLECRGVQLPMASTYLRFRNPHLFQIIDQRVYRAIYGKDLKLPGAYNKTNRENLAKIYLSYLSILRERCVELDGDSELDIFRVD